MRFTRLSRGCTSSQRSTDRSSGWITSVRQNWWWWRGRGWTWSRTCRQVTSRSEGSDLEGILYGHCFSCINLSISLRPISQTSDRPFASRRASVTTEGKYSNISHPTPSIYRPSQQCLHLSTPPPLPPRYPLRTSLPKRYPPFFFLPFFPPLHISRSNICLFALAVRCLCTCSLFSSHPQTHSAYPNINYPLSIHRLRI